MSQPPTFSLAAVERQDIPQLAQIYTLVTLLDSALKLNYPTPTLCTQSITTLLQTQLGDPAWLHIKVVDKATNTIAAWASWVTVAETVKVGEEYAKGLDGYVQQEMDKLLVEWTKGERYMRCKACFVLPEFQRRGMGKELVGCGNEIADRERLPIFLLASPVGFPLYRKYGFQILQDLDIDLSEWVKGDLDNKGYGNYRFRFMVKLPSVR